MALFFCAIPMLQSCGKASKPETTHANVLIYWPTDNNDPAFKMWTDLMKKELERQGIQGEIFVEYSKATEIYEREERNRLNQLIYQLRADGRMPDLILSFGDLNRWLLMTNTNPITRSIPTVCYGLALKKYHPYQYEYLEEFYEGGRTDMVDIWHNIYLKENLDFAAGISPKLIEYIKRPEYYFLTKNRYITLLDVENFWHDRLKYQDLVMQIDSLDKSRYYNNLVAEVDEGTLISMATKQDKIVFSCRSVMSQRWNLMPKQITTTWAFYPQKSPNIFIQSKHDNKSRGLVDGPSAMMYYSMVPEDFLSNPKCIGGYFTPADELLRDAVTAGLRMLKGENAAQIGELEHKPSYNINWDVVRPIGLDIKQCEAHMKVWNATLKDRNPRRYKFLHFSMLALLGILLLCSTTIIYVLSSRAYKNHARLKEYALATIKNNKVLTQMMKASDFRTWEIIADIYDSDYVIHANDFFSEKLRNFVRITEPGNYTLQVHCSFDDNPVHWYELRMTVSLGEDSRIERRGVIINIDAQKKLESLAAETNRIINSVKTREGFIAAMNHQIRTPLNSIIGYTQLLSMPDMPMEPEDLKEYAEDIERNTVQLRNTINNIVAATMLGRSMTVPVITDVRLYDNYGPGFKQVWNMGDSHKLVLKPGPAGLVVHADSKLLRDAIYQLLHNAVQFSEPGTNIIFGWDRSEDPSWAAEIWVADEGPGIAPQYQNLIFDRFFKVDSFTAGCGLGLYICKSYVELMGGQLSVESQSGEGSIFKIKLS